MDLPPTEEEKARARRHLRIIYLIMGIFIFLPFILFWLFS